MQCFCQEEHKLGKSKSEKYRLVGVGGQVMYEQPVCLEYANDMLYSKLIGQSIAFIIVAINVVLKLVIIELIKWVGEDTCSAQKSSITEYVFLAQFFNTGFLITLVNADLTEHHPYWLTKYFKGPFHDYMPLWYIDVGLKITQTMVIQCIMPYVTLTVGFLVPAIKSYLDTKGTGDAYVTKQTSMIKYKMVYQGQDYLIHFKYSDALNVVYVAMTYGLGIPILFPLAAVTLLNQRICEKITVAYNVRQPPAMDDTLSKKALQLIKWAPLFLLFNGYWMLSNQ